MGYVFDYKDSIAYEEWYRDHRNMNVAENQAYLLLKMLKPVFGDTILDIGCGTGETLKRLKEVKGLQVSGIDPSPYMLDIAEQKVENRVDLYRGFAEDLPFDDNAFNHAIMITSLEFTDNPYRAVEEAARVAKDRLFIGALNRYAITGVQRRAKGFLRESVYSRAHFFSVWELKHIVKTVLGKVPISWRTVNLFYPATGPVIDRIEKYGLIQKIPFGTFVGMVVTLVPRYRVSPLSLRYKPEKIPGIKVSEQFFSMPEEKNIYSHEVNHGSLALRTPEK